MTPSGQHEDRMMPGDRVTEEALSWLVRTNDPEFADWEGFTSWLERDPAHADAYHRFAESEQAMLPLVAAVDTGQDNLPERSAPQPRRRWLIGGGLAVASLAAALLTFQSVSGDVYRTGPGEQRRIALAQGDELLLDANSEVSVTGWKRRDVRLATGQVLFRLAGAERLEVRSGDLTIVDIGTVFSVTRNGSTNRVVVDEGAVVVDPEGASVELSGGERLVADDGASRLAKAPAPAGAAEAWTRGQLTYLNAPIAEVAADLARSTGLVISATPATGARRFSGTLSVTDIRRDPTMLGPLLGVPARPTGSGWQLGEDG